MVARAEAALIAVAFGRESVPLLMVVVPEVAPILMEVPAPPTFNVVAPVLKRLPVTAVVVMDPPLSVKFPALVILPLVPLTEKLVPAISLVPIDMAFTKALSVRSMPLVIAPPPEEVTLIPAGRVLEAFLLSTRIS